MARRKKCRWVSVDAPKECKGRILLMADELEAIRLKDVEEVSQTKAAEIMGISQPTLHRILKNARKKIGRSILEGKRIEIKGGEHIMRKFMCSDCKHEWDEPYGTGRPKCPECESTNVRRLNCPNKQMGEGCRSERKKQQRCKRNRGT